MNQQLNNIFSRNKLEKNNHIDHIKEQLKQIEWNEVFIDEFAKSQNQLVLFQVGMLQHGQSKEMFDMNIKNL
jgi:Cft2 family RNA processing exonuclease